METKAGYKIRNIGNNCNKKEGDIYARYKYNYSFL